MDMPKLAYVLSVSTVLAVVAIWQSRLLMETGHRLRDIRGELQRQRAIGRLYSAQASKLRSPQRIVHLVNDLQLGLIHPGPSGRQGAPPPSPELPRADDGDGFVTASDTAF